MTTAVVSFTHLTMGKLFLRTATPEKMAALAASAGDALMSHWTLREPSGSLIIDVHANEDAFRRDFSRSSTMFSDPIHRFGCDAYRFLDDDHEAAALAAFARAKAALAESPGREPAAPPGDLKNRLLSLNHIPQLPDGVRDDVHRALASHPFKSVIHLALRTPQGELLIDPYLNEQDLMDDYLVVRALVAEAGHDVVNHQHQFTDRAHERALDDLAFGLGHLDHVEP